MPTTQVEFGWMHVSAVNLISADTLVVHGKTAYVAEYFSDTISLVDMNRGG